MRHARQRRFDAVLVARFDRFARSVRHLVMALDEFNSLGIDFISLSESIDTSSPLGSAIYTIISAVANWSGTSLLRGSKPGSGGPENGERSWADPR
jgi:DNA invertase Pin-like site-specific DNA recombinase